MGKFKEKIITDKQVWEDFLLARNPQSFLQSWSWGETNKLMGKKVFRIGIYNKITGKLEGIYLAIKEEAKRGPHLLIPAGPIINWEDRKIVSVFLESVKNLGKQERVWFVRVRPELLDSSEHKRFFSRLGFISAPMHLHAENTWILNITPSEEEILAQMRKTTRYLIRKSLNMNLTFEVSTDIKDSRILTKLQSETVKRHGFVGFPETLFVKQLETFGNDGQGALCICEKGNIPLAAAIIIFYGENAYYHHSGSTLRLPSIPSSYFLQWKIIQEAKSRGCKYYNFWGIAPTDNPRHRFAGVTIFKKGFGGVRVDWLHAQDIIISPFYWFTYLFETVRRIARQL
jgi:lipid II:glycine glycyltransferase (peptidoglycan interpeptide bridge formation enzyme)